MNKYNTNDILALLKERFNKHAERHKNIKWEDVEAKLLTNSNTIETLIEMEQTGGEPDVIGKDEKTGKYLFVDCSVESPKDRRSLCYDKEAWNSRKEAKPKSSAEETAKEIGVSLLTEAEYMQLQKLGSFDTKTSSWIHTPKEVRDLGGALFADRRFGRVFVYHNGAESYYAARGFRGILKV